jgi:predicted phosphodiesterase
MRALVISDIHANLQALEAVLAAAPAYDTVWNLGDIVGYGANPNEVIDLARKLGGIVIRGNHDRACSDPATFGLRHRLSPVAATAAIWTNMVLTEENREWLLGLPPGPVKPLRRSLICVHGSPRGEDAYISSEHEARAALDASEARITLFGHTHEQVEWRSSQKALYDFQPHFGSRRELVEFEMRVRHRGHNRLLLNPGSVGQPRDGDWRAAFAIYDDAELQWTWYRIPYAVETAQRSILRAGLPEVLATRLRDGT